MASKSVKCDENGVKIATFLLQNHKNRLGALVPPQASFTVTTYLVTMSRL